MPQTELKNWRYDAKCIPYPPGIFFPPQSGDYHAARLVCMECPVRVVCLEQQLLLEYRGEEAYGMLGGKTPRERRQMLRAGWAPVHITDRRVQQ